MDAFNYKAFTCTAIKAVLNTFENSRIPLIIIKILHSVLYINKTLEFSSVSRRARIHCYPEPTTKPVLSVLLWERDRSRKQVLFFLSLHSLAQVSELQ